MTYSVEKLYTSSHFCYLFDMQYYMIEKYFNYNDKINE